MRIYFDETIAPMNSGLNDVRIDAAGGHAYITDAGLGRLVVVDLADGSARAVLDSDDSTKGEPGFVPVVENVELRLPTGDPLVINMDGIAVTDGWVYYSALTSTALHRVPTAVLRDPTASEAQVADSVERVATTGVHDGMIATADGTVYLTDLERNAISQLTADRKLTNIRPERDTATPVGTLSPKLATSMSSGTAFTGSIGSTSTPHADAVRSESRTVERASPVSVGRGFVMAAFPFLRAGIVSVGPEKMRHLPIVD